MTETILLLIYIGLFGISILLYYRSEKFQTWISIKASAHKTFRFLYGILKFSFVCCFIGFVLAICQVNYMERSSTNNEYHHATIIAIGGSIFILGLIAVLARYLRANTTDKKYNIKGFWLICLCFLAGGEILLSICCLIMALMVMVFGFGRFDGVD